MDSRLATKLLRKCFPEIRIQNVRHINAGWENFVIEVNGEYVFRFPKFKETEKRLKTEIELLQRIRAYLSASVPNYKFVWKGGPKYPRWFGGYPRLEGVALSSEPLKKKWIANLASQISRFLTELHDVQLHMRVSTLPRYSRQECLKATRHSYFQIRKAVYPILDSDLRMRSEALWKSLLAVFAQADFVPTLIHGDLGTENILFDPATQRLTGIIDWGYAQVSDPAIEFAHLFINNPTLGRDVLDRYGDLEPGFERRVQLYVNTEPYYDIMWGVTHDSKQAVKIGRANLATVLQLPSN